MSSSGADLYLESNACFVETVRTHLILSSEFRRPDGVLYQLPFAARFLEEVVLLFVQVLGVHLVDNLLIDGLRVGNIDDLHDQPTPVDL